MPLYLHLLEGGPVFCRLQVPHTGTSVASHRVTRGLQLLYGNSRRQACLLTAPENWQVMQWRSVQKGPLWGLQPSGNHHSLSGGRGLHSPCDWALVTNPMTGTAYLG